MAGDDPWGTTASSIIRSEMVRRRMTYADLQSALARWNVEETEKNLRNKVMRGTFSAGFLLLCLRVLGVETLRLSELHQYSHVDANGRRYALASLRANPSQGTRPNLVYDFMGFNRQWRYPEARMRELLADGRIIQTRPDAEPRIKLYEDEAALPTPAPGSPQDIEPDPPA